MKYSKKYLLIYIFIFQFRKIMSNDVSTPITQSSNISNPTAEPSPMSTENPTTIKPEIPSFKFEKSEYIIKVYADQTGVIEQFKITPVVDKVRYEIVYTVDSSKNQLQDVLEVDPLSGVLRIKKTLSPGENGFTIKATWSEESNPQKKSEDTKEIKAEAKVTIFIQKVTDCKENEKSQFKYAFIKKHIMENTIDNILPPGNKIACEYMLVNQNPAGTFLELDKITGELKSNDKIDREGEAFKDQIQSHITLEVSIRCPSARRKRSLDIKEGKTAHIFYSPLTLEESSLQKNVSLQQADKKETYQCNTSKQLARCDSLIDDNIMFNTQNMKILLIIDDANDNTPQFEEKEYFFGYPDKPFFKEIVPVELGNVKATDKDEGENAAIKYSFKEQQKVEEVVIDPCTGDLYPHYDKFKYKKLSFEIEATDRNGKTDGLKSSVNVTVDILQGHHIMKLFIKKPPTEIKEDIKTKLEDSLSASIGLLKTAFVPSMYELSEAIELDTHGYEILEYIIIYAHRGNKLIDMNTMVTNVQANTDLKDRIVYIQVLAGTPYNYVHSKSFVSTVVVLMLILCLSSLVFYVMYVRTGKYYKCFNFFKRSNTTTPLEINEGSMGTSDYVVSFARMNHVNPTFNIVETESDISKDMFTPVTLKTLESSNTNQIINVEELNTAPTILINSSSNSRRNSGGGDSLSLPGETRGRRKSTVSFNEIVEQYHTKH